MDPLKMMELKGMALTALDRWQAAEDVFKMLPGKAAEIFNKHTFDMDAKNVRMNVEHWEKVSPRPTCAGYRLCGCLKGRRVALPEGCCCRTKGFPVSKFI
jgi:hypothetical protein